MLSLVQSAIKYWREHVIRSDLQGIVLFSLIWIIIGIVNIYSSTMIASQGQEAWYQTYFIKHVGFLIFSCCIGYYFCYRTDYETLRSPRVLYGITIIVVVGLIAVLIKGDVINGAQRWIRLGAISIQPSEFAKLGAILIGAHYIELQRRVQKQGLAWFEAYNYKWPFPFPRGWQGEDGPFFARALLMPFVFAALTMVEPDTGTAAIILALPILLMLLAGISKKQLLGFWITVLSLGVLAFIAVQHSEYRWKRIVTWYDPWRYAQDISYQSIQSMVAIGSGGIFGQGIAQGTAKYYYLPEAHTDFAFAVWSQETGLIGSLILAFVVGMFMIYGFSIASNAKDYYGKLLASGITIVIGGQAVFNMLMVCGMIPVTGVPLPFVSYGGSSLLMNIIAIFILFNIAHRTALAKQKIGVSGHIPSLREETRSRFAPNSID